MVQPEQPSKHRNQSRGQKRVGKHHRGRLVIIIALAAASLVAWTLGFEVWPVLLLALVVFVGYSIWNMPPRHRLHGVGQIEQAVDNDFGVFGRGYRQEPVPRESNIPGRNEECPCGSGLKYKKCCGLESEASNS
jgi:hypothetical protein